MLIRQIYYYYIDTLNLWGAFSKKHCYFYLYPIILRFILKKEYYFI